MSQVVPDTKWLQLKRYTTARIALGSTGASLPTLPLLEFELAHARARDAVHATFDTQALTDAIHDLGFQTMTVQSKATTRAEYLLRPDLGRCLDSASSQKLQNHEAAEVVLVIGDGLSATAIRSNAVPMLAAVKPYLEGWRVGPVVIATQARVALGDEIGELLAARFTIMLIGERPGLSSPDSLGIYLTYGPLVGRSDAERNCISNVRAAGLSYDLAARRLIHLLERSRKLGLSGVALKDESGASMLSLNDPKELLR